MNNIAMVKSWPNGTVVESLQATVKEVYEYRTVPSKYTDSGKTTVQSAVLQDVSGETIRVDVWEHPDLTPLKGQLLVLSATPRGKLRKLAGVEVFHDSYIPKGAQDEKPVTSIKLKINRGGQFQTVAVHNQITGTPAIAPETALKGDLEPSEGGDSPPGIKTPYKANAAPLDAKGETIRLSMCFKMAFDYHLKFEDIGDPIGQADFLKNVKEMTPKLIEALKELEQT